MPHERITSPTNRLIRYARSLLRSHVRNRERAFLVEGPRILHDALAAGFVPEVLFWAPERVGAAEQALVEACVHRGSRVVVLDPALLALLTDTVTPQGLIAIFRQPTLAFTVPPNNPALLLVLDHLQDPGNVGTLLRTALGSGVQAVFWTPGTVDPFAPKVVRAAAGAHFRLPLLPLDLANPHPAIQGCVQRLAAEPLGATLYDEVDWTRDTALVLGSEAHGISSALRPFLTGSVVIPLAGGLESLNVAIAGAVLLFEAARQRRHRQPLSS